MAIQPGVWGIDLGQCALKALRVENIEGVVTATAFDYVEHPKILSQPDADPDQLTREALEKFLSRNSIKGDVVAISIPGQSGLARFVKLPPVEEKKIPDIVRFEAKQQIPFNLEEVVWDYQKLNTGVVSDGFAMETEIGLFAIKRDTVNKYLQHFKDVNVEVHVVQMAPLALCNFVTYDLLHEATGDDDAGRKKCVVALDIGSDNSNLVITDGMRIIWQRPIPLGGNHFTRVLTKDMKLTFAKAEHLKRNATKSPELKQILSSLKPVLNDFVGEVQRSLGYFTNTHRDAAVQYMVGLGSAFRLPGLQKFLSEKLQLDVRRLQKLERLTGDTVVTAPVFTENVLSFAVAYGLTLQGLHVGRLTTNLLPQEIQVERLIRAKKPWAVAAGATMLLGTAILGIGYAMQDRAVAGGGIEAAKKNGDAVAGKASKYDSDYKNLLGKINTDLNGVKSIIIGQEERVNWLKFNQFVNDTLPKPDGSNLSAEAKKLYVNRRSADAARRFLEEQFGTGKGSDKGDDEKWRGDLIQANVESVYCVFSEDLAGFHGKLKSMPNVQRDVMDPKDWATAPEGKGWIVELHGYTYHNDGFRFLSKAIVNNYARLAVREAKDDAAEAKKDGSAAAQQAAPSKDPVINRVSHVALVDYFANENPEPGKFKLFGQHVADSLAAGGASSGGLGEKGDKSIGQGTSSASSWTPLGSGGGVSSGAGGKGLMGGGGLLGGPPGGGGGNPMMDQQRRGGDDMRSRLMGGNNVAAPAADPTAAKKKKDALSRTEFIIVFVWKELTPSDDLRPQD